MSATAPQQPDLMALAQAVLQRNKPKSAPEKSSNDAASRCCAVALHRGATMQQTGAQTVTSDPEKRNTDRNTGATGAQEFAAEATENASEYIAERTAICAADGMAPSMLRHVFTCTLRGNQPFTLLAKVGASLAETEADLKRQFGDDFVSLEPHRSPRPPT